MVLDKILYKRSNIYFLNYSDIRTLSIWLKFNASLGEAFRTFENWVDIKKTQIKKGPFKWGPRTIKVIFSIPLIIKKCQSSKSLKIKPK